MIYVAIIKTAKDSTSNTHKGLPSEYPVECAEYKSEADARAANPTKKVMSLPQYLIYQDAMNVIFEHIKAQKPWWKFW